MVDMKGQSGGLLAELAERANAEHQAVERATASALEHAIRAGELLIEAKDNLEHGQWGPWLEANFAGSQRTAENYMKLSREREQLPNPQRVADLTISAALKSLATPRPPERREAVREDIEKDVVVGGDAVVSTPSATEPAESDRIAQMIGEIARHRREENKSYIRSRIRPQEAETAKQFAETIRAREAELRSGGITVERLIEKLRTGGHEPEVQWAFGVVLDLVAGLTREADPEEAAEQVIRPEDVTERLAQAEAAEEWFSIFREALGRRA